MTIRTPYRDLYVTAGYNRTYYFTFEEDSAFVPPPLYAFPHGTTFRFRAKGRDIDISKSSEHGITYNEFEKRVELHFEEADTGNLTGETNAPFMLDCVHPDGEKYLLLKGYVYVEKTQGLL